MLLANLRGVRESARLFGGPVYWFIFSILLLVIAGLIRLAVSGGTVVHPPPPVAPAAALPILWVFLRGFAAGCAALTGVEAISNGVQAFRPPASRNASITLFWKVVLTAVEYAKSISQDVVAVTVNTDDRDRREIVQVWKKHVDGVPLIVLDSPYRSVVQPLLRFIDEVEDLRADDKVTVLLPEFVPARWWHNLLYNQTSLLLKGALLFRPGIVVTSVPHHLRG